MVRVGIVGGAGYTAGELLRILVNHPRVTISFVHSNSNAGKPVHHIHKDLIGEINLEFVSEISPRIDVLFLCMGHGASEVFMKENPIPGKIRVIDMSQDFRIKAPLHDFVYGLPELNRQAIRDAQRLANPGCFATCIQLAILPLAARKLLTDEVHVNAITGSTGAGQNPSPTTHFSWRNNNVSVYKAFKHQHLREISQSIKQLQPAFDKAINFIPVRGNFSRGIMASVYTKCQLGYEEIVSIFKGFYAGAPFVVVSDTNPDLKQVVNTNKAVVYIEKHDDKVLIISMIDNLVKGASGQAVHNMNLMMGWEETTGLKLKPVGF